MFVLYWNVCGMRRVYSYILWGKHKLNYYKRTLAKVIHIPRSWSIFWQNNSNVAHKMESLRNLSLRAEPCPGQATEYFLPHHHPLYAELQDRFQKDHKKKFR